jgi:1-acyl-sn-glycerol-3-phosphate acyltransferase
VELIGFENIPKEGAYLVTPNHVSLYDPPFVIAFWPKDLEAAGAADILDRPGQNILMRLYGGIPVHRGEVDRTLLQAMITRLNAGYPVLIAPEGTRSHVPGMQQAHNGAAYIAAKTNVPVIPVAVIGSEDVFKALRKWRRATIQMVVGDPFTLPPIDTRAPNRRETLRANTDIIMDKIADLLPAEYRGIYG